MPTSGSLPGAHFADPLHAFFLLVPAIGIAVAACALRVVAGKDVDVWGGMAAVVAEYDFVAHFFFLNVAVSSYVG